MKKWTPANGTEQLMLEDYCYECRFYRNARCGIFSAWIRSTLNTDVYKPPEWLSATGAYFSHCTKFAEKEYKTRRPRQAKVDENQSNF